MFCLVFDKVIGIISNNVNSVNHLIGYLCDIIKIVIYKTYGKAGII